MKVKVCGLNNKNNITEVVASGTDFIGLIFYDKSPRSIEKGDVDAEFARTLKVSKVGVFVNEDKQVVLEKAEAYQLDHLQLHGNESPEYCEFMRSKGYNVWKAFSIGETLGIQELKKYEDSVDLFLFDTKGKSYGGNGVKFNWDALEQYNLDKAFVLSGGIRVTDANDISKLKYDRFQITDVNSGFESEPGLKKVNEIKEFIKEVK